VVSRFILVPKGMEPAELEENMKIRFSEVFKTAPAVEVLPKLVDADEHQAEPE